ncbi:MAG: hypothetical protein ACRDJN_25945, partial [Chloroflexota bacterium]
LQQGQQGSQSQLKPGPLAQLVRHHDERALELYLLILAAASAPPYDVTHPARVWARVLFLEGNSGPAAISKTLARLEAYRLIRRERVGRLTRVVLLRENGSGEPYTHPATSTPPEPYLQLPHAYWLEGWHRTLTLPGKAVLLIALSLASQFLLPGEQAKAWYGISADTVQTGLRELRQAGLLDSRPVYKLAPLSAEGVTTEWRHTLRSPFGHRRPRSASALSAPPASASAEIVL